MSHSWRAINLTAFHAHANKSGSISYLQHAITRTEEWALIWHGQFGHSKTKILTTNESNRQQAITPTIQKQPIAIVRDNRHLGITLTSDLNWSSHVQSLVSMASKRSGLLRLMSHQLPRVVVCTFVRGKHDVTQPTPARTQAPRHSTAPRCISLFSLLFPPSASTYSHQDYMSTYLL